MPQLLLGPLLRHVDRTSAAVWVETDEPCTVSSLGTSTRTFTVHGHHYALIEISGLEPGSSTEYSVELDGEQVWPLDDSPYGPSQIHTIPTSGLRRLLFGSCRVSAAHDEAGNAAHGTDMLRAYAQQMSHRPRDEWPDAVLMLGDQVYADKPPETIRRFIRSRRDTGIAPGEEIADYAEYAQLYRLAWRDPAIRWFLSTVPMLAMFDDHDLRDDWNTSQQWRDTMAKLPWWHERVVAGLGSYWIYQHLGNLSPDERADDPLLTALRAADGDGGEILDEFAWQADTDPRLNRWSFARDFGGTRLIVLDSRCARDLTPGSRRMLDDVEWEWFEGQATGDVDHLIIASSVPVLLPSGLHYVESWNEAVADGAWGRRASVIAERIRQRIDLEHWGAFRDSFTAMSKLVMDVATGKRGKPPHSVVFLSGDVHYSYLARARIKRSISAVYQVVCSPIRNPLHRVLRLANVAASFVGAGIVGYILARSAGVHRTPFRWKVTRGPWFDNSVATLDIENSDATVAWNTGPGGTTDATNVKLLGSQRLAHLRGGRPDH